MESKVKRKRICPVCGKDLKHSFLLNVKLAGRKNNPMTEFCINPECKGWYCTKCEQWHSYGTWCSLASLRGHAICSQEDWDGIKAKMREQENGKING